MKPKAKVQPIVKDALTLDDKSLPINLEAERGVLGAILLDDARMVEAAGLDPGDFSFQWNQWIFAAFLTLYAGGTPIDRLTVNDELKRRGQLGQDVFSYLLHLTDGVPNIHLAHWVGMVREASTSRRICYTATKAINEIRLGIAKPAEILATHADDIEALRVRSTAGAIDLDHLIPIFQTTEPITYLLDPVLPEKAVVTISGLPSAGKSTLVCSWIRDLNERGHAAAYLDRDLNPRAYIQDRLIRVGITCDSPLRRIWDIQQAEIAPQPNDPRITKWVAEKVAATGKGVLVVLDSLVTFLLPGESENDSTAMRGIFTRSRALTRLGATVVILHHPGKSDGSKNGRGSSDYTAAGDLGFTLENYNPDNTMHLHELTLKNVRPRGAPIPDIVYRYADGRILRDHDRRAVAKSVSQRFTDLLRQNPGVTKTEFDQIAVKAGLVRNQARQFLDFGKNAGEIKYVSNPQKGGRYYLAIDAPQNSLPGGDFTEGSE